MFCDGKSYVRSLLQRSMRGAGSEEQLEGQTCKLSLLTLQRLKNVSMYISQRSLVSTLLLSCVPGRVKQSESEVLQGGRGHYRRRRKVILMTCMLCAVSNLCLVCVSLFHNQRRNKWPKAM